MNNPISIVFMGTPDFSVPTLEALHENGCTIQAVFTQPDRPRGRGNRLQPSPVKKKAQELAIPVYQPLSLRKGDDAAQALEVLRRLHPDLIVVIAYGQILPQEILDLPKYGCVNLHASLLPRWRGAGPIQRCILAGDEKTGVTSMQMAAGLDTGDMLRTAETPIAPDETASTLHDRLSELSAEVMLDTLHDILAGTLSPIAQDDALACTADKLTKDMSRLDFTYPAHQIDRTIRALSGFAMLGGKRVKLLASVYSEAQSDAAPGVIVDEKTMRFVCGDGRCVIPLVIQAEGAKAMAVKDYLRGHPVQCGDAFSQVVSG
ncbi:MAG: methionyl-tRNA formyltransferase [Oscillospiraceae bacterium]|nr:methionyl-tRNA formyltransferase [Oscillospiraceae bacterium]